MQNTSYHIEFDGELRGEPEYFFEKLCGILKSPPFQQGVFRRFRFEQNLVVLNMDLQILQFVPVGLVQRVSQPENSGHFEMTIRSSIGSHAKSGFLLRLS